MKYREQQAKNIIFVFLVFTIVSSLSVGTFVTGNAFAKNSTGGGSGSSDKGGGSGEGSKTGDSTTTTGGNDNANSGDDTSNTSTLPEQSSPSEPQSTQQKTCPDGATPNANGNCPNIQQQTGEPAIGCGGIIAGPADKCSNPPSTPDQQQQQQQQLQGFAPSGPGDVGAEGPIKKLVCGEGQRFDSKTESCVTADAPNCPEGQHVAYGVLSGSFRCVSDDNPLPVNPPKCVRGRHLEGDICVKDTPSNPTRNQQCPEGQRFDSKTESCNAANAPSCTGEEHLAFSGLGQVCVSDDNPLQVQPPKCVRGRHLEGDICVKDTPSTPTPSQVPQTPTQTPPPSNPDNPGGGGSGTTGTPIVVKPLPAGVCPAGYHLVAGVVCIKDITSIPGKIP